VFLSAARFGLQFTGKPLNMQTLGSGVADPKGASDSDVLLKTDGDDDNVLSANDDSSAHGTAVCDILDASDDEVILRADESTGDVLGSIPVDDGVSLSAVDLPDDRSMDIRLANYTTVVLVSDNLDDEAIWCRPKH
jgi:hypothetical protein